MKNLLRTLVFDGQVSLTLADTTEMVKEGARRHALSKTSALVLGKTLSAMTFMSACLKMETGEISLSLKSDGTCGGMGVSGNRKLFLRGYIENTQAADDETERECFGENGSLTIIRDDGYNRPFVGSCALVGGNVDRAFEEYFRISEQLPTRFCTAVERDEKGEIAFAGVAVLQPLPFADENALKKTWETDLSLLLRAVKETDVEAAAKGYFTPDETAWEIREATYRCNCSRERLSRALVTLGEAELRRMIEEDGTLQVHCHYCNTDYTFTKEDADELFPQNVGEI